MTQHVFTTKEHSVFCGFDRPLQGFFLVIEPISEVGGDAPVYSNLEDQSLECSHPKSFEHFSKVLQQHQITIPNGLIDALNDDLKHNRGNAMTFWDFN